MNKTFFILKNNIVFGPFSRQVLLDMYKKGKFAITDAVSEDKINWQSPAEVLDLIVPEASQTEPQTDPLANIEKLEPRKPLPLQKKSAETGENVQTAYPGFGALLAMTLGALFAGASMLKRFFRCGANSMLLGGGLMVLTALLLTVLGIVFFGGCYNISYLILGIRCSLLVLFTGALFWCFTAVIRAVNKTKSYCGHEADFLTAMYGMMNMAALTMVSNGVFFVFNRAVFSMTLHQTAVTLGIALLPVLLFIANTIFALSINFISSVKIRSDLAVFLAVTAFWLTAVAGVILLYTIYKNQ